MTWRGEGVCIQGLGAKMEESSNLDNLGVNAKILLKWNLNNILRTGLR